MTYLRCGRCRSVACVCTFPSTGTMPVPPNLSADDIERVAQRVAQLLAANTLSAEDRVALQAYRNLRLSTNHLLDRQARVIHDDAYAVIDRLLRP